jgi:hypothetical protein
MAGITSKAKTLRLYFWAQAICTLALFITGDKYYTLVYLLSDLLMLEMCFFLMFESKITKDQIRTAVTFGAAVMAIACYGAVARNLGEWITLIEGGIFSALGMAMMLCGTTTAVLSIGTLTLAMSVYDFGWVSEESWRSTNGWLPSLICTLTFLYVALANLQQQHRQPHRGL